MRHALMAPHDLAWCYRPKRGKYRRRTDAPATKPERGNRRGRIRIVSPLRDECIEGVGHGLKCCSGSGSAMIV